MVFAKVKQIKIIEQEIEIIFCFDFAKSQEYKVEINIDDKLISSSSFTNENDSHEIIRKFDLPADFQGKQLRIYIANDNKMLIYSKLLPKILNKKKTEWIEWISKVGQNSKAYKQGFYNEFEALIGKLEGKNDI